MKRAPKQSETPGERISDQVAVKCPRIAEFLRPEDDRTELKGYELRQKERERRSDYHPLPLRRPGIANVANFLICSPPPPPEVFLGRSKDSVWTRLRVLKKSALGY